MDNSTKVKPFHSDSSDPSVNKASGKGSSKEALLSRQLSTESQPSQKLAIAEPPSLHFQPVTQHPATGIASTPKQEPTVLEANPPSSLFNPFNLANSFVLNSSLNAAANPHENRTSPCMAQQLESILQKGRAALADGRLRPALSPKVQIANRGVSGRVLGAHLSRPGASVKDLHKKKHVHHGADQMVGRGSSAEFVCDGFRSFEVTSSAAQLLPFAPLFESNASGRSFNVGDDGVAFTPFHPPSSAPANPRLGSTLNTTVLSAMNLTANRSLETINITVTAHNKDLDDEGPLVSGGGSDAALAPTFGVNNILGISNSSPRMSRMLTMASTNEEQAFGIGGGIERANESIPLLLPFINDVCTEDAMGTSAETIETPTSVLKAGPSFSSKKVFGGRTPVADKTDIANGAHTLTSFNVSNPTVGHGKASKDRPCRGSIILPSPSRFGSAYSLIRSRSPRDNNPSQGSMGLGPNNLATAEAADDGKTFATVTTCGPISGRESVHSKVFPIHTALPSLSSQIEALMFLSRQEQEQDDLIANGGNTTDADPSPFQAITIDDDDLPNNPQLSNQGKGLEDQNKVMHQQLSSYNTNSNSVLISLLRRHQGGGLNTVGQILSASTAGVTGTSAFTPGAAGIQSIPNTSFPTRVVLEGTLATNNNSFVNNNFSFVNNSSLVEISSAAASSAAIEGRVPRGTPFVMQLTEANLHRHTESIAKRKRSDNRNSYHGGRSVPVPATITVPTIDGPIVLDTAAIDDYLRGLAAAPKPSPIVEADAGLASRSTSTLGHSVVGGPSVIPTTVVAAAGGVINLARRVDSLNALLTASLMRGSKGSLRGGGGAGASRPPRAPPSSSVFEPTPGPNMHVFSCNLPVNSNGIQPPPTPPRSHANSFEKQRNLLGGVASLNSSSKLKVPTTVPELPVDRFIPTRKELDAFCVANCEILNKTIPYNTFATRNKGPMPTSPSSPGPPDTTTVAAASALAQSNTTVHGNGEGDAPNEGPTYPTLGYIPPYMQGLLPLECAARAAYYDLCDLMIKYGANSNMKNFFGVPVLCAAAAGGTNGSCVKLLLARGADPNAADHRGRTAIFYATSAPVVRLLLNGGADILRRDFAGDCALGVSPSVEATECILLGLRHLINDNAAPVADNISLGKGSQSNSQATIKDTAARGLTAAVRSTTDSRSRSPSTASATSFETKGEPKEREPLPVKLFNFLIVGSPAEINAITTDTASRALELNDNSSPQQGTSPNRSGNLSLGNAYLTFDNRKRFTKHYLVRMCTAAAKTNAHLPTALQSILEAQEVDLQISQSEQRLARQLELERSLRRSVSASSQQEHGGQAAGSTAPTSFVFSNPEDTLLTSNRESYHFSPPSQSSPKYLEDRQLSTEIATDNRDACSSRASNCERIATLTADLVSNQSKGRRKPVEYATESCQCTAM